MRSIALAAVFFAGCSDFELSGIKEDPEEVYPVILVEPQLLEFSGLGAGEEEVQSFDVTNTGFAPLELSGMTVDGSNSFTVVYDDTQPYVLDVDETFSFDVIFTPRAAGDISGRVLIANDAINADQGFVDLTGAGNVPHLEITPDPLDFGSRFVRCPEDDHFTLKNTGEADLKITAVVPGGDGQFQMQGAPGGLPVVLAPGDATHVTVTYEPTGAGPALATLAVESNDPQGVVSADAIGEGVYPASGHDPFVVPENPPVDILFAVDQSCSMDDQATALAQAFGNFIGQINNVTHGWRIGVVTLDSGCFNSGVLTAATPNYTNLFSNAVTLGDDSESYTEQLLRLSAIALGKTGPGACNANFLRPGALLHIIVVSDEKEQSGTSYSTWLNTFYAYVASPSLLKVSAIVDENVSCGDGSGAGGYLQAANATGGEVLNVCNANWGNQVGLLAAASLSSIYTFELTGNPDPLSIAVEVDGTVWNSDWHYDPQLNAVVFDIDLDAGQAVDVRYGILGNCP